jgi:hypothetical protein
MCGAMLHALRAAQQQPQTRSQCEAVGEADVRGGRMACGMLRCEIVLLSHVEL